jgi:hypothetical protein
MPQTTQEAMHMDKQELLGKLDQSHRELMGAYTGLSEQALEEEPVDGQWTVRDLLIHISHWHDWALGFIDTFVKDGQVTYVPPSDFDTVNAQVVSQRRENVNMIDLVDELTTQYRRMRQAIMSVSPEQLQQPWPIAGSDKTRNLTTCVMDEIEHDNEHAEQILKWREERGF